MARRTPRQNSRHSERLAEARRIELIPLAKAAAGIAVVTAVVSHFAIRASVKDVFQTFGAFVVGTSRSQFFLLNYVAAGCLALGAAGLLARKTWGWWLAFAGALIGIGDMVRIYSGLFAIINPDHPKAAETTTAILQMVIGPALLFVGLAVLLCLRPMRETYRISSRPRG